MTPQARKILLVVVLAPFMTQLDTTIVNVSLSTIRQDLHAPISTASWIISAYLLALALMLPLNAWLVDRFGVKKLYLFCFATFTLASVLCGAAPTINYLIAARVLQGMAGGLLAPLAQLMIARIAGKQMARYVGYVSAPIMLAPLFGPPLAGAILKQASWPWLFYVNLPIGVLGIVLAAMIIPSDHSLIKKRPFDLAGFLTLSPGLACFLYGFERPWFLLIGIILLAWFLWIARQKKERALIDIELFKNRTFTIASMTQFLSNGIGYCGQFLVPLYMISGAGLSPMDAGWVMSAMGVGLICVYPLMGRLTDWLGGRAVSTIGVAVNVSATLPFLWMAAYGFNKPVAVVCLLLRGMGHGATGIPSLAAAYASVPHEKLSFATTSVNIVQRLGGPVLTTGLSVVVAYSMPSHSFVAPFITLIFFQLLILGTAIQLPKRIHAP